MTSQQTQAEQNKALVRQMFDEIWNKRQIEAIGMFYASDRVADTTKFVGSMFAAFAEWQLTVDDIIAEGDQVAVHWHNTGTHQGEYLGIPATGKRVTFEGMGLQRVVGGKIVDDSGFWDNLSIQQELGSGAS